jgi:poly(hydroxyalkanoate) depolymerase family esterase
MVQSLREAVRRMFKPTRTGTSHAATYHERSYKLFVPARYRPHQAAPLLVMLHGCTQDADDFAAGTAMNGYAEQAGCLVVYPEQSERDNRKRCWNWFRTRDQQRGFGEPADIVAIVEQVKRSYNVDAARVYVAGISAGACMAVILGVTYPDLFAAVGSVAGLEYRAASTAIGAYAAMKRGLTSPWWALAATATSQRRQMVPLIAFHGSADEVVIPLHLDRLLMQWAQLGGLTAGSLRAINDLSHTTHAGREGYPYLERAFYDKAGKPVMVAYSVDGLGHAWPGGNPRGSFADPLGPRASQLMLDFFLRQRLHLPSPSHRAAKGAVVR